MSVQERYQIEHVPHLSKMMKDERVNVQLDGEYDPRLALVLPREAEQLFEDDADAMDLRF